MDLRTPGTQLLTSIKSGGNMLAAVIEDLEFAAPPVVDGYLAVLCCLAFLSLGLTLACLVSFRRHPVGIANWGIRSNRPRWFVPVLTVTAASLLVQHSALIATT